MRPRATATVALTVLAAPSRRLAKRLRATAGAGWKPWQTSGRAEQARVEPGPALGRAGATSGQAEACQGQVPPGPTPPLRQAGLSPAQVAAPGRLQSP